MGSRNDGQVPQCAQSTHRTEGPGRRAMSATFPSSELDTGVAQVSVAAETYNKQKLVSGSRVRREVRNTRHVAGRERKKEVTFLKRD